MDEIKVLECAGENRLRKKLEWTSVPSVIIFKKNWARDVYGTRKRQSRNARLEQFFLPGSGLPSEHTKPSAAK